MENRELIDQIYYLREKADNNKLAVFVGAGVSCNVQGMPSWAELVAKMAKEVGYVKCNNCRRKKDCESKCGHCEIIHYKNAWRRIAARHNSPEGTRLFGVLTA